jgi:MFS transporter, SP family, solute carrier family 2 (myo-inositol transporter), member 13
MEATAHAARAKTGQQFRDSLLRRKYVIPFLLACVILFCNTATGVNSIIGYNTGILLQSGLSDLRAHWGYVIFTVVNFLATMIGITLVDRKGRKFSLVLGTSGVIVALVCVAFLFRSTEKLSVDCRDAVQTLVSPSQDLTLRFDSATARSACWQLRGITRARIRRGRDRQQPRIAGHHLFLRRFTAATNFVRSDDAAAAPIEITRESCVPANRIEAFFKNPFADLECCADCAARDSRRRSIGRVPEARHGWLVALGLYVFMAFYALGPGVVRVAGTERADAYAHPLEWNEHCAGDQSTRINNAGRNLSALREQARLLVDVLSSLRASRWCISWSPRSSCRRRKGKTLEEIEAHFAGKTASSS